MLGAGRRRRPARARRLLARRRRARTDRTVVRPRTDPAACRAAAGALAVALVAALRAALVARLARVARVGRGRGASTRCRLGSPASLASPRRACAAAAPPARPASRPAPAAVVFRWLGRWRHLGVVRRRRRRDRRWCGHHRRVFVRRRRVDRRLGRHRRVVVVVRRRGRRLRRFARVRGRLLGVRVRVQRQVVDHRRGGRRVVVRESEVESGRSTMKRL